ncbi:MAG: hypothetical protein ACTHU0_28755 [Kofleriaceae bacterium]
MLGADGQPLYVDPSTDFVEFRRAVGQVPGIYRLDQCDDNGNELEDAQPAYVSIDVARNAQTVEGTGDVNPLVIIQQMAAIQADVMKTMAAQQAALMAATAEILRAPYRPAPVAVTATEIRNASASDQDDDRDDDREEDASPESPATTALRMLEPHLPQLGAFLYDKCAEFLRHIYGKNAATSPAATPSPLPVSAPAIAPTLPQSIGESVGVAAGASSTATPPPPITGLEVNASTCAADEVTTNEEVTESVPTAPGAIAPGVVPVAPATAHAPNVPPIPTREQLKHLSAIRAKLSPTEQAIAQHTISRMEPQMLASWLAALSAMSVDEATELIRRMVAEIHTPRGSKPR